MNNSNNGTLTSTLIGREFNLSAKDINKIFSALNWAYKDNKYWIPTKQGKNNGAIEAFNTTSKIKYIRWMPDIITNTVFLKEVNKFKNLGQPLKEKSYPINEILENVEEIVDNGITYHVNKKVSYKQKVNKGKIYEEYVAKFYRNNGWYVWEHGADKGRQDGGIDLIAKKDKEIILIQCKDWDKNYRKKIKHTEVKAARTDARKFMKDNPLFIGYKIKFRFTLSREVLHKSAYQYIEENNDLFDYEILEILS
jgi:restriction system protein